MTGRGGGEKGSVLVRIGVWATALTAVGAAVVAIAGAATWCVRTQDSVEAVPKIQAYIVQNDQWRAVQDERWDEIHEWMQGMGDAMGVALRKKGRGH